MIPKSGYRFSDKIMLKHEREEHRDLDHDWQAAGERVDLLLLVELDSARSAASSCRRHGAQSGEVDTGSSSRLRDKRKRISLADVGHFRLHRLHLRHRGVGLAEHVPEKWAPVFRSGHATKKEFEREEHELDQHGDDQDREAEVADQVEQVSRSL
jgi:hypothetical protein